MKKLMVLVMAMAAVMLCVSMAAAQNGKLADVNTVCGTSYGCALCHVNPDGRGELTAEGAAYAAAGYSACFFCPNDADCGGGGPTCTDADADNYFVESTCGTTVDCNDNSAVINPGAVEVCTGGIDNDCDGKIDCADTDCSASPSCATTTEICNDTIDNDGDGRKDCADRDCRNDPACSTTPAAENTRKLCGDNKDNDGDGKIDCGDTDCAAYCK